VWKIMPLFSALSLIVVLSSMGLPGLNGFVGEFTILLGSMGSESLGSRAWIYTAFATTGVILAAVYLLWMFQRVFMGPVSNDETAKMRDINRGELVIMLSFLLFIFWIGIAPAVYFRLMDGTVQALLNDISTTVVALVR
jgi:NADH-quinone oxidoreductase subunit M